MTRQWEGFEPGLWQKQIDVRDFIQQNRAPYEEDESLLAPATRRTKWRARSREEGTETASALDSSSEG